MHHHELDHAMLAKQLAGKMRDVTLVAFWASWCKPCTKELPQLDKLAAAEHDPRVAIVAVDLDHERADAERFLAANHLTLPVVFDPDAEIYQTVFLGSRDMVLPSTAIVWAGGVEIDDGYEVATDAEYIAKLQGKLAAHLGR
jgi:thiol-disulfide isomerase/thioredoxin